MPVASPGTRLPGAPSRDCTPSPAVDEFGHRFESKLNRRNAALRRLLADLATHRGRVLETGCGSGRFLRAVAAARPDLETHGCDVSSALLRQALVLGGGPRYTLGSLTALPYRDGSMDAVMLLDVLEHVPNPGDGLAEIARVLRPGGLFHALVPCEGQPFTLHWAMWKLHWLEDLKERHGGHIQRFTHDWVRRAFAEHGLSVERVTYSMHPIGQVRDVLTYAQREDWFQRLRLDNPIFRVGMKALWAGAFAESQLLQHRSALAVTMHVRAIRAG